MARLIGKKRSSLLKKSLASSSGREEVSSCSGHTLGQSIKKQGEYERSRILEEIFLYANEYRSTFLLFLKKGSLKTHVFKLHKKAIKKLDKLPVVPYTIYGLFTHLLGHRHRVLRDVHLGGTRHFSTATLVSLCLNADLTPLIWPDFLLERVFVRQPISPDSWDMQELS
jgi:hypothetical protein